MSNNAQIQDHDWEQIWFLNPDKRNLIDQFRKRADEENLSDFERFANAWIAFNAFGSIACGFERDHEIITALGLDQKLNTVFSELRLHDKAFADSVDYFQSMWPVYSESSAFRVYQQGFKKLHPNDKCYPDEVQMRALCKPGVVKSKPDDARLSKTWENVLSAIYQVRCNPR